MREREVCIYIYIYVYVYVDILGLQPISANGRTLTLLGFLTWSFLSKLELLIPW